MFRVEFRFSGNTLWSAMALPATLQAAQTIARGVGAAALSDETRVVEASPARRLDVRA